MHKIYPRLFNGTCKNMVNQFPGCRSARLVLLQYDLKPYTQYTALLNNIKLQVSMMCWVYGAFELGPLFRPKLWTTFTNLLLYCIRLLARPVFFFFFSCGSTYKTSISSRSKLLNRIFTLGVCPLTFPARARDP